jgi:L-rhamnose mutarotase
MKRYGMQIGLRPGAYDEYKRHHAAVWPDVLAAIDRAKIRNYTIYHHDGTLFATFEYHGHDFAADSATIAADPATQRWWAIMETLQQQLPGTPAGEWWMPMEELFHFDGTPIPPKA